MAARGAGGGARVRALYSCEHWEIVKPSVIELSREVRTNILCTVNGCGKILPNPPALNMHLVKSHGVQHFMKMHAEKKHKCEKCGSCYGTEWDLKRHIGYCGKTFRCTCGCPYTSRTALLSHTHRMGHEIPVEHRDPPVKKRKIEESLQNQKTVNEEKLSRQDFSTTSDPPDQQVVDLRTRPVETFNGPTVTENTTSQPNNAQKLLLPKPKLAYIKLPVMQYAHLPVFVSHAECSVTPVVVTVNGRGSLMTTVQLVPHYNGSAPQALDNGLSLPANQSHSRDSSYNSLGPVNSSVQVNLDKSLSSDFMTDMDNLSNSNKITSDVQTDLSYFAQTMLRDASWPSNELSVSSCSQTDLSFSAQVSLPISVETQTFQQNSQVNQQMEASNHLFAGGISRETQTNRDTIGDGTLYVDQAVMCGNIFATGNSLYTVSTQTSHGENSFERPLDQNPTVTDELKEMREESIKSSASYMTFNPQNGTFPSQNMTDNQTQTMELLSDLEKIFSDNSISGQALDNRSLLSEVGTSGETHLSSGCGHNTGIDFDIDEFFSASNIQTQTEESEMGTLSSEYLDIETQTDFLFSEDVTQAYINKGNSNLLGMEMFDTHTQTDLNFFLGNATHLPLGNILKQSSFSMSADSSDGECGVDVSSDHKNEAGHNPEGQVQQNCAETQTTDGCAETLNNLFLTSNETQTAMDDFLLADLAWNTMESQFSSVETQTCEGLVSLFSEKSEN
uniref:ATM interactor n=1 Tax=Leptobrachium leishanense TaxID=445787 RepID=A0A8C5MZS6_9ANUR